MTSQVISGDTIKLLRECSAGIKMGIDSIDDVLGSVKSAELREILVNYRRRHEELGNETRDMLNDYSDSGKDPSPIASGMSWLKTNIKLTVSPADSTIADLMSDGCSMGVKSVRKYLNEYAAAEEKAKAIADRLIILEESMENEIKSFL